ncbi:SDR family NAD(P)-dependent oxidoreductase [candidate division KSB1 bacterium]|nr:SDR family NAD(P)-dependent oxidoreductase [candidate division KSB1 bacterium]
MQIQDKIALVTGASRGIGRAMTIALAEAGAHLAVTARNESLLAQTVTEIRSFKRNAMTYIGDMRDETAIKTLVQQTIDTFGRLDILINNAGVAHFSNIADMKTSDWDEMFNLNMRGVFLLTRECLPYLRHGGESVVVNVASLAGKNTFIGGGGYTATKHALRAFSQCLMLEERKHGVRILSICPGSVATNFGGKAEGDQRDSITQPEDVAASVLHMIQLPQRAMVSEIDIRPTNP